MQCADSTAAARRTLI